MTTPAALTVAALALSAGTVVSGGPSHGRIRDAAGRPDEGPYGAAAHLVSPAPQQAPDSSAARSRARSLQSRFERHELRHLPLTLGGDIPECDEIIGRFCIWDEGDTGWTPKEEAEEIVKARNELLDELEAVAREIPGDHWVFGQRIRYLFEAGRHAQAASLARRCALPARWRCDAYLGYVLYRAEDISGAEQAFRRALESMPAEMRVEWTDPDPVLDRELRRWLSEQPDSAAAVDRLWKLGDGLLLTEGNDRWTAHLSRWVYAMSSEEARNPFGIRWGDDLTEIIVRYGWTTGWERSWPQGGLLPAADRVAGRGDPQAFRTFSPGAVLERDPGGPERVPWEVAEGHARSTHRPPFVDSLDVLDAQAGRFWRQDGVVVVGAWTAPRPGLAEVAGGARGAAGKPEEASAVSADVREPVSKPVRAGLFVEQDGVVAMDARATGVDPGGPVRLSGHAPFADWGVLSMEVWAPATRQAARHRLAMGFREVPPDLFTLSDLMLLEPRSEPEDLDAMVEVLRPSTDAGGDEVLGLAFEVYGLRSPNESVGFKAWVEKRDEWLITRLVRRLGFGRKEKVTLSWREGGPDRPGPLFRTFTIRLPDLDPGAYDVVIEVSTWGRSPLQTRRSFTVR
ncbi:MAG: hypothetical protein OXQ94_00705 [Gemmatimonadota bacterium]|nr:hypothetical protein [Gemmatimonadota bacterium]MDE2870199.1 hypothetical protein [Gemmatimonadota bacterium]